MTRLEILNWWGGLSDKERSNFIINAHNTLFDDGLMEVYLKYDFDIEKGD